MSRVYRSRGAIGYWLAVVALAVGLAWVIVLVISLQDRADSAAESSDVRQQAVDLLAEDIRTLREQVEASGQEPAAPDPEDRVGDLPEADDVEPPIVIKGPRGPAGDDAPPPTVAQIRQAVSSVLARDPDMPEEQVVVATAAYLEANPPADGENGADGDDGEPGRPPTSDEIYTAVAAYCADGACKGDRGDTGARGPGPTDAQIAAAVAAYCNDRGECRGAPGRDGTDGQDGSDGRGIVSVDCNGDADLVITYDQPPLTEVIEGPCRMATPDPTPTGTPDPSPTIPTP